MVTFFPEPQQVRPKCSFLFENICPARIFRKHFGEYNPCQKKGKYLALPSHLVDSMIGFAKNLKNRNDKSDREKTSELEPFHEE